jgi:hypothetical protein
MNSGIIFKLRNFGLFLIGIVLVSCSTRPYQKLSDQLIVQVKKTGANANQSIRLQVVTNSIIHVSCIPGDKFVDEKSLMVLETLTVMMELNKKSLFSTAHN